MKIAYLHFRFAGTDGVSLEAEHWDKILKGMGHELTLVAGELDRPGKTIPLLHFAHPKIKEIHDKVTYEGVPFAKVKDEVFETAGLIEQQLLEYFTENKFDLLIVSNVFSLPIHFSLAIALSKVIKTMRLKTLSRNHDFWWERERYEKPDCYDFFKEYFPPKNEFITHLTINSLSQTELKKRTGIEAAVVTDSFDFDDEKLKLDHYSRLWRSDLNINPDDFVFLQATRIIPRKQIELAIELVKRLRDPRIVFVVSNYAGDEGNDYFLYLKKLAKEAQIRSRFIGDRVLAKREIIDGVRFYTLWDCYVNADFVTYPSAVEGFGNQFLEAIAFKKPVFVNRYDVYKSDIEPLGFETVAINGEVTESSVEKVRILLNHREMIKEITDKNFLLGKKYFSYEAISKKLVQLGIPNVSTQKSVRSRTISSFKSQYT